VTLRVRPSLPPAVGRPSDGDGIKLGVEVANGTGGADDTEEGIVSPFSFSHDERSPNELTDKSWSYGRYAVTMAFFMKFAVFLCVN
jgi:hypothetical protein